MKDGLGDGGGGVGLGVFDDLAVAHGDDAVGGFGDGGVVGDEDHGVFALMMDAAEEVHDLGGVLGVEVAGGFVGEEDGGFVGEAAGDGDALALTAGEFFGHVIEAMAHADGFEEFCGAALAFGAGPGHFEHGHEDVFEGGEGGEEEEGLEDEAEVFGAELAEFGVGGEGLSAVADFA